jgi:hypothetical protein
MPSILYAGSEGELALFENVLDETKPSTLDDKRRGAVKVESGDQMYRAFPPTAHLWVHCRVYSEHNDIYQHTGKDYITVLSGAVEIARVHADNYTEADESRFLVEAITAGAGGSHVSSPVFPHGHQAILNYDIQVEITTVTNPNDTLLVRFYRNEVLRWTHTATDPDGFPLPDALLLEAQSDMSSHSPVWFQDIILTDSLPTVGMELATLVPSAVGQYNQFTNDYSSVNGPGYDPSTVIASDAIGQKESWIFADPDFDLGDKVIYGVCLTTVAQTDLGEIVNDFRPFLRIATIEYDGADLGANNIAPDAYTTIWTTNPNTNQPWTQTDLKGLEAGIQSV